MAKAVATSGTPPSAEPAAGPTAWRNWRAAEAGRDSNGAFEYAFYTDALTTGELTTGPYRWLNTIAHGLRAHPGHAAPAIVLRAEIHLTDEEQAPTKIDWEKTDTKDYLAGDLGDELAGLGSLALGRRLRSGGLTRRFEAQDERGVPLEALHERPRLIGPPPGRRSILPSIEEGVELSDAVELLERYPRLGLNDARGFGPGGPSLWSGTLGRR